MRVRDENVRDTEDFDACVEIKGTGIRDRVRRHDTPAVKKHDIYLDIAFFFSLSFSYFRRSVFRFAENVNDMNNIWPRHATFTSYVDDLS